MEIGRIRFFRYAMGEFPRHSVSTKTQQVNHHKFLFYWLLITTYSNFNKIFCVFCIKFGNTNYTTRRVRETREVILINRGNNPCIYEHKGYS